jgi:hypothetical protein
MEPELPKNGRMTVRRLAVPFFWFRQGKRKMDIAGRMKMGRVVTS